MTELHTYYLSTAENELGVVIAYSESGVYTIYCMFMHTECQSNS